MYVFSDKGKEMAINYLEITNFRNLEKISINLHEKINLLHGDNGGGKTSLLESIYYLAFSRSFRSNKPNNIVNYHADSFAIFASLDNLSNIGIERCRNGDVKTRINGQNVTSKLEIANLLPLQLINADSYEIITSGPKLRRQFIDWGVFHVEPSFINLWKRMQRVLEQRNALLKANSNLHNKREQIKLWDEELTRCSLEINNLRERYLAQFTPLLAQIMETMLPIKINIEFYQGWNNDERLPEVLERAFMRDIQIGYTQHGAHRADLKLNINNTPASETLSRGQQKLLICAMKLTQSMLLQQINNKKTIFLIDDLPSELDIYGRKNVCNLLNELNTQLFITGINSDDLIQLFDNSTKEVFHVKQGEIIGQIV